MVAAPHVRCFREKNDEFIEAIKILHEDCAGNFTPYVDAADIVIGNPWLTEEGPNYIAFDDNNTPLGFLAVGWNMTREQMMKENISPPTPLPEKISCAIREDFSKIEEHISDLSQIKELSPQEACQILGGSYNIFLFVAAKERGHGVGSLLLSFLPEVVQEKNLEGRKIRYKSRIANLSSVALLLKVSKNLGLRPDVYLEAKAGEFEVANNNSSSEQFISFLLSHDTEGIGFDIIENFVHSSRA
jgi:hypothetical protein